MVNFHNQYRESGSIMSRVMGELETETVQPVEDDIKIVVARMHNFRSERIGRIARDCRKVAGVHFTEKNEVELIKRLVNEERFHKYRLILFGTEHNLVGKELSDTKEIIRSICRLPHVS